MLDNGLYQLTLCWPPAVVILGEYAEERGIEEPFPFPTLMVIIGFLLALVSTLFARNIADGRHRSVRLFTLASF